MFDNIVLRKTFEYKLEEITGEWKKIRNEQLHSSNSLPYSLLLRLSNQKNETGEECSTHSGRER